MFTFELNKKLASANYSTISVAAHPGLAKTNLDQYFPSLIRPLGSLFLQPAEIGALPVLYAALSEDIKGGEFVGPDGIQQLRGYPTLVEADEYTNDEEVAKKLWEVSEEMADVFYLDEPVRKRINS